MLQTLIFFKVCIVCAPPNFPLGKLTSAGIIERLAHSVAHSNL